MIKINYQASNASIIIVGSESTIGKALTQMLITSGAAVYGIDITEESSIKHSATSQYFKADPTKLVELAEIKSKLDNTNITGLVCLSGTIKHFGTVLDLEASQWQEVYDISFKSCYNACKLFAPIIKNGAIVNMSSGLAYGGQKNYGPYTNAKAAVISLSRTLATELAPDIRVNSVAPGAVDTPFIYNEDGSTRFDKALYKSITPLNTLASPDEIADLIMFLLSGASSHITGQCIHINGGAMMY